MSLLNVPSDIILIPPKVDDEAKLNTNIIVRMADEGIPVAAIVRVLKVPANDVRDTLHKAQAKGIILAMPRDDWPRGSRREDRLPDTVPVELTAEECILSIMRTFGLTPAQATMFAVLLKRPEAARTTLHLAIQRTDGDLTDPKIVDVIICKLRKKLPLGIEVKTIWGRGYYIPRDSKQRALAVLESNSVNLNLDNLDVPEDAPAAEAVM